MNLAFLGCGKVGAPLADHLQRLGHGVTLAVNDPASATLAWALARNPGLRAAGPAAAVAGAEVVFLATPFQAALEALGPVKEHLRGKVLVDCTNPVGPGLKHGLDSQRSGTELFQAYLPGTRVVKAFTVYGYETLEDNRFPGGPQPAMPLCGDDAEAKGAVAALAEQLGWRPLDVGSAAQALHLEHLTLLWIRRVRVDGRSPGFAWAVLER